mmetsp:Transcript_44014/g.71628  ORF Transcript_44014/g.71628 Transcript_44014/m.71628 type:complete len:372 (+) Transcript_44014:218-1333(+)|eukprot:CAMPEP_0184655838 /NCGR_PEP_ID=MMETSP0308-20130426/14579_1 /TAXON_ID=38269 /ORGANISM="Gloeochaete witrockiana, Strain SAG 46.84" /LENGTH=371 /DNA_ID=CAMNT_0027092615 /DNA_START=194 /DNA_END=1309 /DNA_ORIENTATION=+
MGCSASLGILPVGEAPPSSCPAHKSSKAGISLSILTRKQKDLLRESWALLMEKSTEHGRAFYKSVMHTCPAAKALFRHVNMNNQAQMTFSALDTAISHLLDDDESSLAAFLVSLGRRHVRFGVTVDHFSAIFQSFLGTFERALGERYTPDMRQMWEEVLGIISKQMQHGLAVGVNYAREAAAEAEDQANHRVDTLISDAANAEQEPTMELEPSDKPAAAAQQLFTEAQIKLVRDSWVLVVPSMEAHASKFYSKVFELAPAALAIFAVSDLKVQGRLTFEAIDYCVKRLDDGHTVGNFLKELGRRHARYGVEPAHFNVVGDALIWTLKKGLGAGFTPEVEFAWVAVYSVINTVMLEGLVTGLQIKKKHVTAA